jgi:branched-chain amino acid transport system substrate-binding protein
MKSKIQFIIPVIAIVLIAAFVAGCTQQAPSQQQAPPLPSEIKIGVIASLTGPWSNVGTSMWQSAQIAAKEINANGGISIKGTKVPIKLIVGNDESTPTGGQNAATQLITGDKVDILVGGYSSLVTSSYEQTIADNKIPFIVTGASSPIITHNTNIDTSYIFHHCPTTGDYGQYTTMLIDQVVRPAVNKQLNASADRPLRLALLYQNSAFGLGVQSAVNDTINKNKLNIQLVSQISYKTGRATIGHNSLRSRLPTPMPFILQHTRTRAPLPSLRRGGMSG